MFPSLVVIDNFFPNPDKIVEYANTLEYYRDPNGYFPGGRTVGLHRLNPDLDYFVGRRVIRNFYDITKEFSWDMTSGFHKTIPMHEDKHHPKNRGIVYPNTHVSFSGIVYLNKTFEEDTGTTIYKLRKGWSSKHTEGKKIVTKHWLGETVSDDDYNTAYKHQMDQYEETITIKSTYNRLVIFSSDTYHAAQTYGSMGERLSMYFYGQQKLSNQHPPLFR